ncbi:MAG: RNA 2',3'-cyclic phosphodiesterase [Bryobacteraceae bacterium]|jgi:2'-5' RNA ligase
MRLFTGLDLEPGVAANLERLIEQLRPTARVQWSPPANLHITTKFIGEWPDERLAEFKTALAGLPRRAAIPVRIHDLGFFPNPHAPRIFWCGIEAPGLAELAAETDRATAALGVQPETRAFSPHLTLARIKDRSSQQRTPAARPPALQALREAIAGLSELEFGSFVAAGFYLYQSQLRPGGSVYTKLAEFPFQS